MDLNQGLKYLGALIVLLLIFGSGWLLRDISADSDVESLLKDREIQLEEIEVVRTRNSTLVQELKQSGEDREVLLDQIASLRSRPEEIRYITKVETVMVGEPTFITTELPESHTFRTDIGLPVAEFAVEGQNDQPEYVFDTADLKIEADLVIAERDSALSLRITSDLEPGTQYEVPVDKLHVTNMQNKRKFFEPNILVGAHLNTGVSGIKASPHLGVSLLHPRNDLDLVQIRFGSTSGRPSIGLDPVLYNLGDPLPIFTNMWIGAGADIDTSGTISGTVSVGAKL